MLRMNRFLTLLLLGVLLIGACQPIVVTESTEVSMEAPVLPKGGAIILVNDIEMYYEIHGVDEPLLLMPGDMRTTEDVVDLTALLAKEYQVIVMDARGRGRSTDSEQPLTMAVMADDAVALLDELSIDKAHVVSWASSAGVGMEMAMRYPERVDKLVLHGPNYTVDGLAPDHLEWFASLNMEEVLPRFEEQYNRTAPDPSYLLTMLDRFQELVLREPNYTVEMLSTIIAPTLVIDGDMDDWIVREHLETLAATVPNGELVLLPELTHFAPFEDADAWTDAVMNFLRKSAVGEAAIPRIEPTECVYSYPEGTVVECSYLIVRENRAAAESPTTRVFIQHFKSANPEPASDPVIFMPGGPGSSGPFYAFLATGMPIGQSLNANRDLILMEYRGATLSEPAFFCPELETETAELAGISYREEVAWTNEAWQSCYDRLVAEGHDLSAYDVAAAAADVADLHRAMGLDEINVIGVSYGTPVLMELLREHGDGIRAATLDSINPPEVNYYGEQLKSFTAALDAVFAACAGDPVCAQAYPDFEVDFFAALAKLRDEPVKVTVDQEGGSTDVTVDDLMFVNFVYDTIFIGGNFAGLPAAIDAVANGDYMAVAHRWLNRVGGRHGPSGPGTGVWSWGLTHSMRCMHEGALGTAEEARAAFAAAEVDPSVRDWATVTWIDDGLGVCDFWDVTPPEPNTAILPVESDVPALMLVGTFDPAMQPYFSVEAAERFTNRFFYELPTGHAIEFTGCGVDLIDQFLTDPTQAPDASCIDEMTPNWVLLE